MFELWRISQFASLGGEGGLLYSARWHTAGRPIVYLAESPAGALLEVLVHLELDPSELPSLTLLRVQVKEEVPIEPLTPPAGAWQANQEITRRLGDEWLTKSTSVLTRVPSVIVPHTFNVLFNPLHPEAGSLTITVATPIHFDRRLFRASRL